MILLALYACDPDPVDSAGGSGGGDSAEDSGTPEPGAIEVALTAPEAGTSWDECEEVCFTVAVTRDGAPVRGVEVDVEVEDHGFVGADLRSDADGLVTACATGLPVGAHQVAVSAVAGVGDRARGWGEVDIRPFGWSFGLQHPQSALAELPWTPVFEKYAGNPVLSPGGEGTWDGAGLLLPTVVPTDEGYAMYVAGTSASDYVVGGATSPDGTTWTESAGNPLFPEDPAVAWKIYSTNSPVLLNDGAEWLLYYTGRATETGELSVGLATGDDPFALTDYAENPVMPWDPDDNDWAGSAVAHPSVIVRDGVYHLWYSGGRHKVGYALSADGRAWTRYCHNPVLEGAGLDWESNQVKSTEVAWIDPYYVMTYSGGGTGAFQVGWAMSTDGVRWVRAEEPVLSPAEEGGTWESTSTIGAAIIVDEAAGVLRAWYGGTGLDTSAIGYAEAPLP